MHVLYHEICSVIGHGIRKETGCFKAIDETLSFPGFSA